MIKGNQRKGNITLIKEFLKYVFKFVFDMFADIHHLIGLKLSVISETITTFAIIFLFSLIYLMIRKNTQKTFDIELKKRKEILMDIDMYKKTHPELLKGEKDEEKEEDKEYAMFELGKKKKYPDKYYEVLNYIASERWKGKPHRIFIAIFIQLSFLLFFISYIPYFHHDYTYINFEYLFLVAVSLNILQIFITKRFNLLSVLFVFVLVLIYYKLPYELLLLLALNNTYSLMEYLLNYR